MARQLPAAIGKRFACIAANRVRMARACGGRGRLHAAFTHGWGFINKAGRRLAPRFNPLRKESFMKRLIPLMLLAMFSMSFLSACNTMAGAGKDVQKVGEKVEDKAGDCKDGKC
jgi:entericidin A